MATIPTVPVQRLAPFNGLQRGLPFQALPGQALQAVPMGQFAGRRVAVPMQTVQVPMAQAQAMQAVQVPTMQRAVFAQQMQAVPVQQVAQVQAFQPVARPVAAVPMQAMQTFQPVPRPVQALQAMQVPVQAVQVPTVQRAVVAQQVAVPVQAVPRALPVPVGYAAVPQVAVPQVPVPMQPVAQNSNALVVANTQNVGSWWGEDSYGYGYGYGYTGYGYPAASAVPYATAAPFATAIPVAGYAPAAAAAATATEEAYAPVAPTTVPAFTNGYFDGYNGFSQGFFNGFNGFNGYAATGYPVSSAYGGFFPGYGAVPFTAGAFGQTVPVVATGATVTRQAVAVPIVA